MGLFSKKNDKKNDQRRTSDEDGASSTDSVDVDGRLGLPEDVSMNSLDYLGDTGELLARSAPTVSSQDGAAGGGWHMPDVDSPSPENDLGSEESFATFFGDDPEASSHLESFVPDSYDPESLQQESFEPDAPLADSFETAGYQDLPDFVSGDLPPSLEATEHVADHDRRLDDLPPMAAAGTSELAATSDFLAVGMDDDETADDYQTADTGYETADADYETTDLPVDMVDDPFAPPPGVTAPLLGKPSSTPDLQPIAEAPVFDTPVSESPFPEPEIDAELAADENVDLTALALASSAQQSQINQQDQITDAEAITDFEPVDDVEPAVEATPTGAIDVNQHGPTGTRAATLLEILGLDTDATWTKIGETHRELSVELLETIDGDPSREAVSRAIQREMNTAYAALRLMAVG